MKNKTAIQEMISEFEEIQKTKCKSLQEVVFFTGILAIIESKYLEKERSQIVYAYSKGCEESSGWSNISEGVRYYKDNFNENK